MPNQPEMARERFGFLEILERNAEAMRADIDSLSALVAKHGIAPENDTLRVKTKSVALTAPVETLTIDLNDVRDTSATLNITWAKTRVPVKIDIDVVTALVPQIEAAMAGTGDKKPYAQAAMFYLENNLDLKKAAQWMDAAIAAQPDLCYLVYRKGLILEKMGDKTGALAAAKASLVVAEKATMPALKDEYVRRNNELIARLK